MSTRRLPRAIRLDASEKAYQIIAAHGIAPLAGRPGWFVAVDRYTGSGDAHLVNMAARTCTCVAFGRGVIRWGSGIAECKHVIACRAYLDRLGMAGPSS